MVSDDALDDGAWSALGLLMETTNLKSFHMLTSRFWGPIVPEAREWLIEERFPLRMTRGVLHFEHRSIWP
jgi:hypothetical protein